MAQPSTENVTPLTARANVAIVMVTPDMAARWLERNTHNRRLDIKTVDMFARTIHDGRWHLSNDAVAFDFDGTVLNGQHRLTAILKTGVTCPMLVLRNVAEESQVAMDTGKKRTAGDHLAIVGYRNYSSLAAVARVWTHYSLGTLVQESTYKISNDQIAEVVANTPELLEATERALALRAHIDAPTSVIGAAFMPLYAIDPDDAAIFANNWAHHTDLAEGDPILALIRRLAEVRRTHRKVSRAEYLALIFRAWNAWRDRRQVTGLPLRARPNGPVEIPQPH